MKLLLLLPLFIISCSTAEININNEDMKPVKTIAIVPFTASIDIKKELKKEILSEAEESFRSVFTFLNYKVVEREKSDTLFQTENNTAAGAAGVTKKFTGADTILYGEILEYREIQRDIHPFNTFIFGSRILHDNDEIKTKTFFKFQIVVKLINATDGAVILTLKNRYIEAEKDDYLPGYISLESYRRLTLKKMNDELIEILKTNNQLRKS